MPSVKAGVTARQRGVNRDPIQQRFEDGASAVSPRTQRLARATASDRSLPVTHRGQRLFAARLTFATSMLLKQSCGRHTFWSDMGGILVSLHRLAAFISPKQSETGKSPLADSWRETRETSHLSPAEQRLRP